MVNDNGVTLVADEATGQMYDLSGQPVGPRKVERGPLVPVPVVETKWYAWAAFHPETTIETLK
jgi:hypothetical protein